MNERWVCKRCFAANDDSDAACRRCGLMRGAEATAADQAGWSGEAAAEPAAWRGYLRYWWVPVMGVVLLVGFITSARRDSQGELEAAGTVTVDDLRAGDCFNGGEETEIAEVDGVPCDEPHEYQVFAVAEHDAATFPTDAQLDAVFDEVCAAPFEAFVGEPYASSALWGSMITPSEESWGAGDREFICVLYDPNDAALTGSMENANR